jgi:retron-type reverse transcriptase
MDQPPSTTEHATPNRRKLERDDTREGLPPKLSRLRRKLAEKAKREPGFRFYALYDRIYRPDTLRTAWLLVAANRGAPGVDGVTIQQIQDDDPHAFVAQLQEGLRTKTYQPLPIRRKYIPKGNGKTRPLCPDGPRPGRSDGDIADPGADLRGGLSGLLVRIPPGALRP